MKDRRDYNKEEKAKSHIVTKRWGRDCRYNNSVGSARNICESDDSTMD